MAKKATNAAPAHDAGAAIETAINKTELFFEKNSKSLTYVLLAIIVAIGGYFGYKYLYNAPRQARAENMIFVAQQQFAVDSFALALNGDGNNAGFLDVVAKYGSTTSGNIAKHYAGLCYLRLGDLDNALKYLKQYAAVPGVPSAMINAQNIGLQGDVYSQKGDYKSAVAHYERAATAADNSFTAPYYLKKAGLAYEKLGDDAKAKAAFERIRDSYPSSMEAYEIEKYIGEASQI
ncbi:MAG: tetratricopeptide repeat protein [Rikenellaceae bacterium]|jgi:tetratricopeptide (TPR) repeat protein|nr:tetratricopeptide repeat protein [Rikenellaceae bacterium]